MLIRCLRFFAWNSRRRCVSFVVNVFVLWWPCFLLSQIRKTMKNTNQPLALFLLLLLTLLNFLSQPSLAHSRQKGDSGDYFPELSAEGLKNALYTISVGQIDVNTPGFSVNFTPIITPVSFVIFIDSNGDGYVPIEKLYQQVDQLNTAFSGEEAVANKYPHATDSKIRFQFVGVRYVVDDTLFNDFALPSYMASYRPMYQMNPAKHMNVYSGYLPYSVGLSFYPYDTWFGQPITESFFGLGCMLHWEVFPGNNWKPPGPYPAGLWPKGNILTHEVGHFFGVRHPYDGGCIGTEADSDDIYDTPRASANPFATCAQVQGLNSCPNFPGNDDVRTYMVATSDSCRDHFTPQQVLYMQMVALNYKPTLMSQPLPDCVAAVSSLDTSPDLQPCIEMFMDNGVQKCYTDPNNKSIWAFACCPSGWDWLNDSCRQGTPDFQLPTFPIGSTTTTSGPSSGSGSVSSSGSSNGESSAQPTSQPTRTVHVKKHHWKKVTVFPTSQPTSKPTPQPTTQPIAKHLRKHHPHGRQLS